LPLSVLFRCFLFSACSLSSLHLFYFLFISYLFFTVIPFLFLLFSFPFFSLLSLVLSFSLFS
jgi:hypothetical protein